MKHSTVTIQRNGRAMRECINSRIASSLTTFSCVVTFSFFLGMATVASAGARPSFSLDLSVWRATHIVLATEGDLIDGHIKIIESWKGDLEPGARVVLPGLADFADVESRRVHNWWYPQDLPEPYARVVTGSRTILFLVKPDPAERTSSTNFFRRIVSSKATAWLPAVAYRDSGFKFSVAWLERGEAYAFRQVMNPGPVVLAHIGTAVDIKARVVGIDVISTSLGKAIDGRDSVLAGQCLKAFEKRKFYYGAQASIESLGRMGTVALPTLRRLLGNESLLDLHSDVISAMAAAGRTGAARDLATTVEEGLRFWQERLPTLTRGWWNSAPDDERRLLRNRYGILSAALQALRPLRYAPCREDISALRNLWQSDETLNDVGDGAMIRACDAVLEELDRESPYP